MPGLRREILANLAAVICSLTAVAQEKTETLFVMAKTDGSKSPAVIQRDFRQAIEDIENIGALPRCSGVVEIPKPIPEYVYNQLNGILRDTKNDITKTKSGIELSRMPVIESKWEFKLPDAEWLLDDITINYEKKGDVTYKVKKSDTNEKFTAIEPGRYAIPLIDNDIPKSYKASITKDTSGNKTTEEGVWPKISGYHIVTIKNFSGPKQTLFNNLKNEKITGVKKLQAQPLENYSFVFANFVDDQGMIQPPFIGTIYPIKIDKIDALGAKRVWVLFPLTKKTADELASKLNDGKMKDTEISQEIRKLGTVNNVNLQLKLDKNLKWIELLESADKKRFEREIDLINLKDFYTEYPDAHMLIVYEFDNGKDRYALPVGNRLGKNVLVNSEPLKSLTEAIADKLRKDSDEPKK